MKFRFAFVLPGLAVGAIGCHRATRRRSGPRAVDRARRARAGGALRLAGPRRGDGAARRRVEPRRGRRRERRPDARALGAQPLSRFLRRVGRRRRFHLARGRGRAAGALSRQARGGARARRRRARARRGGRRTDAPPACSWTCGRPSRALGAADREQRSLAEAHELLELLTAIAQSRFGAARDGALAVLESELAIDEHDLEVDKVFARFLGERARLAALAGLRVAEPAAPRRHAAGAGLSRVLEGPLPIDPEAPRIAVSRLEERVAERRLELAKLGLRPDFRLGGGFSWPDGDDPRRHRAGRDGAAVLPPATRSAAHRAPPSRRSPRRAPACAAPSSRRAPTPRAGAPSSTASSAPSPGSRARSCRASPRRSKRRASAFSPTSCRSTGCSSSRTTGSMPASSSRRPRRSGSRSGPSGRSWRPEAKRRNRRPRPRKRLKNRPRNLR